MRRLLAMLLAGSTQAWAANPDHRQFDATLTVPFRAAPGQSGQARVFTMHFEFPQIEQAHTVSWQLDLLDPHGVLRQRWQGAVPMRRAALVLTRRWRGRTAGSRLPAGLYSVRLLAVAHPRTAAGLPGRKLARWVAARLADPHAERVEQRWQMQVGPPLRTAVPLAATAGMATAGQAVGFPYTVYLGNLHSQTNHSDGGGPLAACTGAQPPQAAPFGPRDAYQYAMAHGLDFLMASEHNHLYDGADGSDGQRPPAAARQLYQDGLRAAQAFSAEHPAFLALYGMEWGIISHGGHLNIFGSRELFGWERDRQGQLIGERYTAKGDYAALYALMRAQGLLGQFNHPAVSGQFAIDGVELAYHADGDQVMALCEVLNSPAFSHREDEGETRRSTYESACQKALEAGYHLAFSSDQDNHCANWGAAAANRTGVLLPAGAALSEASLMEALRARRVFATMDKRSVLIATANGHLMGERFANHGALQLAAYFASDGGRSVAAVQWMAGVPGRRGTVELAGSGARLELTPAPGPHFYYARLTQDDGKLLWSAPVWVEQAAP